MDTSDNKPARPAPFFVGEQLALDLLNSVCAPWGEVIEWLGNGKDLLDWLLAAELLDSAEVKRLTAQHGATELDKIAAQARQLRETFRDLVMRYAGQQLDAQALHELQPLNELLREDRQHPQAGTDKDGNPALVWRRDWQQPEQLLTCLALPMLELLCSASLARVKQCEGHTCPLWFLDTSKNQRRRWCTMAVCGNRAKAAAHRARNK